MNLTKEQQEEFYEFVMQIYDRAENLLNIIERPGNKNPELELKIAKQTIEQVESSVPMIADALISYADNNGTVSNHDIKKMENGIRNFFVKAEAFINNFEKMKG